GAVDLHDARAADADGAVAEIGGQARRGQLARAGHRELDGAAGPGQVGAAAAVPFLRDTGLFWFFDPGNVELIVKVLDACGEPYDRFWVFAGGLTNVGVRLQVTDTVTGDVRIYQNTLGQRFQPIQDTDAFETCP
ncbi:MAG: hypothetical protein AAGF23_11400, partial [Acidobacteriota bacterium]